MSIRVNQFQQAEDCCLQIFDGLGQTSSIIHISNGELTANFYKPFI